MSSESKRELIAQELESVLKTISRDNGYWHTLEEESVFRRAENFATITTAQLPAIAIQTGLAVMISNTSGFIRWRWPIRIYGAVKSDDPSSGDTHIERLLQDVIKVIGNNFDLSSNVETLEFTGARTDLGVIGTPNMGLFDLEITVQFSHDKISP